MHAAAAVKPPCGSPPLCARKYDSLEGLWVDLEENSAPAGFGVYKIRIANTVDGKPTRVDLGCKRGNDSAYQGVLEVLPSLRAASSQ